MQKPCVIFFLPWNPSKLLDRKKLLQIIGWHDKANCLLVDAPLLEIELFLQGVTTSWAFSLLSTQVSELILKLLNKGFYTQDIAWNENSSGRSIRINTYSSRWTFRCWEKNYRIETADSWCISGNYYCIFVTMTFPGICLVRECFWCTSFQKINVDQSQMTFCI